MKKRIITLLLSLTLILVMAVTAEATTATKPINVDYLNIQLFVNGNAISLQPDEEPFIYNGRTFVPIRLAAEALNQNVEWIDWIKAVKLTGADTNTLAEKDKEIANLKAEIASLQSKIDSLESDSSNQISDLEDALISDYDNIGDVEIDDISLDGDEDDVDVQIDVNLDDYGDEWDALDDSDIENLLEDVVSDIQDEFSEDTVVTGEIIDTDSDDVLVDFDKDGTSSLDVNFNDEDYRSSSSDADDVMNNLEDDSYYVGSIEFEMSVSYDDDDTVTAKLTAVDSDAASAWDGLSNSRIDSDVTDICADIASAFDDDAGISLGTVAVKFYDDGNDKLDSFEYDVDNDELN